MFPDSFKTLFTWF